MTTLVKVSEINGVTTDGSNGLNVNLNTAIAGERNETSATTGYLVTHDECNYTVVDVSTDAGTTISAVPSLLMGLYVNVATATQAVDIRDGGSGGTDVIVLPTGLAAGTFLDLKGIRFETDLFLIESAAGATGNITVLWRVI